MTSNSEESSLWNLTLRPTAAAFISSNLIAPATKLRIDRASEQFDRQVTKHGGFGAIALVHRDPSHEYTDLLDFIFFLENHKINVTRGDVVQKSAAQPIGLQGNSVEVFKGTYYDQPVALKYLRRSRLPDTAWRTTNKGEYNHLLEVQRNRQRDVLFECKVMACNFLAEHRNIVKLLGVFFEDDEVLPDENSIFAPVMIVELADQRFPDLNYYLASNDRPKPIVFEDASGLISDIADGISALHFYGIIHADIKPGNILLFPEAGTDKLIAKIADFGFSGIITSDDNARGGTAYWNAPEIIKIGHLSSLGGYKVDPSHSYRDVYSFGLVSMLIALDGQWPIDPEESRKLKLNDGVTQAIAAKLRKEEPSLFWTADQQALFIWLAEGTLRLKPEDRWSSLAGIRVALTGKESDVPDDSQAEAIPFSLMDSVTGDPDERYRRGWQYPNFLNCYGELPLAIRNKLKTYSRTVDLEKAEPVIVAQIFFLATAMLLYGEDYTESIRLQNRAAAQMEVHASLNIPEFTSVTSEIKAFADSGLRSDLELYLAAGNLEPSALLTIREGSQEQDQANISDIVGLSINNNWGPLHYAACFNRPTWLEKLVASNPNLEEAAGASKDSTPLAIAAREGNFECVKILLQHGALPDPKFTGMTRVPLREAIIFSDDSQKYVNTIAILLEYKASTSHGGHGTAPIHNAAHLPKTAELLVRHNPKSLSYRDFLECTPLHHAVKRRSKESVRIFLELGADVNATDENGSSPLHDACRILDKRKRPYHNSNLKEFLRSLMVGTDDDAKKVITMLRNAEADIDLPMSHGSYGPESTPDSFLYDISLDITQETISVPSFAVSDGWIEPHFFHTQYENATISCLKPIREKFCIEALFHDVYPNYYDLIIAIGWIKNPDFHPPSIGFTMSSLFPKGVENPLGSTPIKRLQDLCPEEKYIYTFKAVDFATYARKDLKVKIMVMPNDHQVDMGGLVIKYIRIQRQNPEHDFERFVKLDASPFNSGLAKFAIGV